MINDDPDQNSRGARRGDDGRADRRAPRERRRADAAARRHAGGRARRARAGEGAEARPVLHAGHAHARSAPAGSTRTSRRCRQCDWIIEAIVERLDVKQSLFARIEQHRRADAIVSSNTSGIPIAALAEGRSDGFRRHLLGTHFFNPPRYLRLARGHPDAGHRSGRRRRRSPSSPTAGSARASSSRRTRRTSSPTTSASTA